MLSLLAAVAAYLVGSISFAIVFSQVFRLADPRSYGSGNPGATNVLRSGHKGAAILTLIFDALKGWFPVWACATWGASYGLYQGTVALVALAAFCGHLFPLYHRFKGGKGVATALGVIVGISPFLALASVASFVIVVVFTRYVSLASIVAAAFAGFYYIFIHGTDVVALAILVMGGLLVWRHAANIDRLLRGTESRLGKHKKPA